MKRHTIFLTITLLAVLASSCSKDKPATPDRAEYDLRGEVAEVKINTYSTCENDSAICKNELISQLFVTFNEEGKFMTKHNGKDWKVVYTYDNNMCKREYYSHDKIYTYYDTYYNEWGGDSLMINCCSDGTEYERITYLYNNKKQLIEKASYDNEEKFLAGDKFMYYANYEYNKKGNLVKYSWYMDRYPDYEKIYYLYYNNRNQLDRELIVTKEGKNTTQENELYEYNDHGFISKHVINTTKENSITEYTSYEYDQRGNYTTRKIRRYKRDKQKDTLSDSVEIIEREITYFE